MSSSGVSAVASSRKPQFKASRMSPNVGKPPRPTNDRHIMGSGSSTPAAGRSSVSPGQSSKNRQLPPGPPGPQSSTGEVLDPSRLPTKKEARGAGPGKATTLSSVTGRPVANGIHTSTSSLKRANSQQSLQRPTRTNSGSPGSIYHRDTTRASESLPRTVGRTTNQSVAPLPPIYRRDSREKLNSSQSASPICVNGSSGLSSGLNSGSGEEVLTNGRASRSPSLSRGDSRSSSAVHISSKMADLSLTNGSKRSTPERRSSVGRTTNNSYLEKGGRVGLSNLGNTCFMNSVLQCLSNSRPLLEYCLEKAYSGELNSSSKMKGNLFNAYADLMRSMWDGSSETYVNPSRFKSQITLFARRFDGYHQQDSQEFLRYLLEGLHDDVNRVKHRPKPIEPDYEKEDKIEDTKKAQIYWDRYVRMDNSKIVDLFMGQLKSTLKCDHCGYLSTTFDPFWDLSLPIPSKKHSPNLLDCIKLFTQTEILDHDERPVCGKCKTRRRCSKSLSIQKFPRLVVLHLKRFSGERYRSKMSAHIEFPIENLDLSEFAAESCAPCSSQYNLYGVSNHSGTVYQGHYTAYCKHAYSGRWFEFNDTRVQSVSDRSIISSQAYVLFYELVT